MSDQPERKPLHQIRLRASDWALTHLNDLADRKGYQRGYLLRLAVDLGVSDLIQHYKRIEAATAAGYDTTTLESLFASVRAVQATTDGQKARPKRTKRGTD